MSKQLDAMIKKQTSFVIELQGLLEFEMNSNKPKNKAINEAVSTLKQATETLHLLHLTKVEEDFSEAPFISSTFSSQITPFSINDTGVATLDLDNLDKAAELDRIRYMSDAEYKKYKEDNL